MQLRKNLFLGLALLAVAALFVAPLAHAACGGCGTHADSKADTGKSCGADCTKPCCADKADASKESGCTKSASACSADKSGCTKSASACSAAKSGCSSSASATGGESGASQCDLSAGDCAKKVREYYKDHGWLGVEFDLSASDAGPRITKVYPNSPASKAGLEEGDILTSLNGISAAPEYAEQLHAFMQSSFDIDKKIRFTAKRGREILPMSAVLTKIPDDAIDVMINHHLQMAHAGDDVVKEKADNVQ